MKQFGKLKTFMAAGVAVATLSALCAAQAQDMTQNSGIVRAIRGSAKYSTGGGVWMPLKKGDKLPSGSTVQADAESVVDIFLGVNGPALRVTSDTTMVIDNLSYSRQGASVDTDTKLNLQDGRILGSVRKLSAASKYEIKTPTGVAGIRGTDYDITTRKNAAGQYVSNYNCYSGGLIGADTGGTGQPQSFQIQPNQGFTFPNVYQLTQDQINDGNNNINNCNGNTGGGGGGTGGPHFGEIIENPFILHISPIIGGSTSSGGD